MPGALQLEGMKRGVELYRLVVARDGVENVNAFVTAVHQAERWEIARRPLGAFLVLLGPVCWIMAAFPGLIGARARGFFLAVWAMSFAMLVLAVAASIFWRRRSARYRVGRIDEEADDV